MRVSLAGQIVRAWRHPRQAMALLMETGPNEARSLFHVMLACGLFLVASLPNAVRISYRIEADDPLSGAIAAHMFSFLFVAPLLFYVMAALLHLVARVFRGSAGFAGARAALFWSALIGAPLALGLALIGVAEQSLTGVVHGPVSDFLGYALLAWWIWLLASAFAEAEGFAATSRVMAVMAVIFLGMFGGMAGLTGALTFG